MHCRIYAMHAPMRDNFYAKKFYTIDSERAISRKKNRTKYLFENSNLKELFSSRFSSKKKSKNFLSTIEKCAYYEIAE
jgi:hypothetical protein